MPTNRGGPTPCESQAERPTGSGSPRARATHSIMALSLFEQVPVLLSTRFVRDPNSTSRPQRGPLVSRSTTLPQWLLDWACSLPLSARCPTQPCHPQPPRRPLTRHRNGRGDLRGVPRPKAVRGPPRECRHSAAGWPKRCLVGGLPAWLAGASGRGGEQVPLHPFPHFPRGGQLGEAVGELADSPDRKMADRVEHRLVTRPRHAEAPQPQRQQ